jgi:hypothetical protein
MLRHIGLDAADAQDVEVLVLNVFNGYLVAVPRRYTPLGEGRWHVDMAHTGQGTLDIVVDDLGLVTNGCGEFLLRHRPGR